MDESEAFRRAVERGAFAGMNKPKLEDAAVVAKPAFRLPWNTTRTLADVWAVEDAEQRMRDRAFVRRSTYRPTNVTHRGKIRFAGYDKTEVQFKGK